VTFAACFGVASSQESGSDPAPKAGDGDSAPATIETCFTARGLMDMNVLTDRHAYVQTRGHNHYLLTLGECEGVESSYHREEVRLVPYGTRVCRNDGSYLVYNAAGRELPCPILTVDRVTDRAEAKLIAEGKKPRVEIDKVDPVDRADR
jgi:hypothetical protein